MSGFYAKRGIVYNQFSEVVCVVTPVLASKEFCKDYAKLMAEDLNDTFFEESELLGSIG